MTRHLEITVKAYSINELYIKTFGDHWKYPYHKQSICHGIWRLLEKPMA